MMSNQNSFQGLTLRPDVLQPKILRDSYSVKAWHPENTFAAINSVEDGVVGIWNCATGLLVQAFNRVEAISWSKDGSKLLICVIENIENKGLSATDVNYLFLQYSWPELIKQRSCILAKFDAGEPFYLTISPTHHIAVIKYTTGGDGYGLRIVFFEETSLEIDLFEPFTMIGRLDFNEDGQWMAYSLLHHRYYLDEAPDPQEEEHIVIPAICLLNLQEKKVTQKLQFDDMVIDDKTTFSFIGNRLIVYFSDGNERSVLYSR